jgi:REP element-mobilizing transposase RayT
MDKLAYHITTTIHDSRTSDRMIKYRARERRFGGAKPYPEVYWLTEKEEELIAETLKQLVEELDIRIAALNICRDHMHILLVCTESEVPTFMHRIKGRTARVCNAYRAQGTRFKGINPLEVYKPTVLKDKSIPFWSQKFGCKPIRSQTQFWNTYHYICGNRAKYGLPRNPRLEAIIELFLSDYQRCFGD